MLPGRHDIHADVEQQHGKQNCPSSHDRCAKSVGRDALLLDPLLLHPSLSAFCVRVRVGVGACVLYKDVRLQAIYIYIYIYIYERRGKGDRLDGDHLDTRLRAFRDAWGS